MPAKSEIFINGGCRRWIVGVETISEARLSKPPETH